MMRLVFLLSLLLWLPLPALAQTLKIATLAPDGTSWMKAFRDAAGQIENKTAGRVTLRYYPGGVMGDDKTVLRKIRVGQLHGGALGPNGMANIHPDSQILAVPLAFDNYAEVDKVRQEMDPFILGKLKEAGFVAYGLSEGGFAYMMSERRITNLKEAQGSKVWVPEGDPISRVALESLGISPVPLAMTDVLTGLQTRLIDAVAATATGAIALQWHTKVRHLTDLPLIYTYGTLALSEQALDKLSAADRDIVGQELRLALDRLNAGSRLDNAEALKALKKHGVEIDPASAAEIVRWREKVNRAMETLTGDKALTPALLQQLHALIKAARGG